MIDEEKKALLEDCSLWMQLSREISAHTGKHFHIQNTSIVPGGDINTSYVITNGKTSYFTKLVSSLPSFNDASEPSISQSLHQCEAQALEMIAQSRTIRCPRIILTNTYKELSYLVMEYLPLQHQGNEYALGEQLAKLHTTENPLGNAVYGLDHNNFIGTTRQINTLHDTWTGFWSQCRLLPQIKLLENAQQPKKLIEKLYRLNSLLTSFFGTYTPQASLLHGDLWSGNKGFIDGEPVIFDPACYYGDRETDIALTELFGGFTRDFYQGYESVWPLDEGYSKRKKLYNLYHLLNHLNLFGEGYLPQCLRITEDLLSQLDS